MTDDNKPLLHLVFGGHVKDPTGTDFDDLDNLDIVGIFPNRKQALDAWRSKAQQTVDDANMKYVLVHMHRLLDDPESEQH